MPDAATNRRMLRVRDAIDRRYAEPLDLHVLSSLAHVSPDHLVRTFRAVFSETPHRYLQRRRIERAMHLLRTGDLPVTEICVRVGFTSLGTFGRTFHDVVGEPPSSYRSRGPTSGDVPGCVSRSWSRPATYMGTPSGTTSVSEKHPEAPAL